MLISFMRLRNIYQQYVSRWLAGVLFAELILFPHAGIASRTAFVASATAASGVVSDPASVSVVSHAVQALPAIGSRVPRRTRTVVVTAYSSTVDQTDDTPFITANGTRVRDGIVAANFLAFNTRVRIPELYGDKIFSVTDRMHERFSDRIDIWMETRKEAREFGVKVTRIEVY